MDTSTLNLKQAVQIAKAHGATRLLLFGSYRDHPDTARDLDLAVAGVPGWKLYELAAALEEALQVPLDLISLDAETPLIRRIEAQGEVLYAAG